MLETSWFSHGHVSGSCVRVMCQGHVSGSCVMVMCQVSGVMCQVSCVRCHVSGIMVMCQAELRYFSVW